MYKSSRVNFKVFPVLRDLRILAGCIIRSSRARRALRRNVQVDIEGL